MEKKKGNNYSNSVRKDYSILEEAIERQKIKPVKVKPKRVGIFPLILTSLITTIICIVVMYVYINNFVDTTKTKVQKSVTVTDKGIADAAANIERLGNLCIYTNEAKVTIKDEESGKEESIELTALEYRLLLTFANNRGVVLTRNRLLSDMWDISGDFVNDNTLTVYIKRLRDKIEKDPSDPKIIKTVRGMGYIVDK